MKYGLGQKSSEKAGVSSGDQGLEKVRRKLCSGHGLQAYFCLFPFNDHGSIHKVLCIEFLGDGISAEDIVLSVWNCS